MLNTMPLVVLDAHSKLPHTCTTRKTGLQWHTKFAFCRISNAPLNYNSMAHYDMRHRNVSVAHYDMRHRNITFLWRICTYCAIESNASQKPSHMHHRIFVHRFLKHISETEILFLKHIYKQQRWYRHIHCYYYY
jgi:hypothetical protein